MTRTRAGDSRSTWFFTRNKKEEIFRKGFEDRRRQEFFFHTRHDFKPKLYKRAPVFSEWLHKRNHGKDKGDAQLHKPDHSVGEDCNQLHKLDHSVGEDCKQLSKLDHSVGEECKQLHKLDHSVDKGYAQEHGKQSRLQRGLGTPSPLRQIGLLKPQFFARVKTGDGQEHQARARDTDLARSRSPARGVARS